MKKILLNPWTALITLTILVTIRFLDPSFVQSVRLRYFDEVITAQPKVDVPVYLVWAWRKLVPVGVPALSKACATR